MAPAPAPVLDELGLGEEEDIFMSLSIFFMVWYYVEVVAAIRALASVSWDSVRPLLVAALAMQSRLPPRTWRARSLAG